MLHYTINSEVFYTKSIAILLKLLYGNSYYEKIYRQEGVK